MSRSGRMVPPSASIPDRRGWDRLPISIPFFVRGRNASGQESLVFAPALNVSGGGVLLAMRCYLEPGTGISLEVPVAVVHKAQLPHSVFRLYATVMRCTRERDYFLLGLRFEEPLIDVPSTQLTKVGEGMSILTTADVTL